MKKYCSYCGNKKAFYNLPLLKDMDKVHEAVEDLHDFLDNEISKNNLGEELIEQLETFKRFVYNFSLELNEQTLDIENVNRQVKGNSHV